MVERHAAHTHAAQGGVVFNSARPRAATNIHDPTLKHTQPYPDPTPSPPPPHLGTRTDPHPHIITRSHIRRPLHSPKLHPPHPHQNTHAQARRQTKTSYATHAHARAPTPRNIFTCTTQPSSHARTRPRALTSHAHAHTQRDHTTHTSPRTHTNPHKRIHGHSRARAYTDTAGRERVQAGCPPGGAARPPHLTRGSTRRSRSWSWTSPGCSSCRRCPCTRTHRRTAHGRCTPPPAQGKHNAFTQRYARVTHAAKGSATRHPDACHARGVRGVSAGASNQVRELCARAHTHSARA